MHVAMYGANDGLGLQYNVAFLRWHCSNERIVTESKHFLDWFEVQNTYF